MLVCSTSPVLRLINDMISSGTAASNWTQVLWTDLIYDVKKLSGRDAKNFINKIVELEEFRYKVNRKYCGEKLLVMLLIIRVLCPNGNFVNYFR